MDARALNEQKKEVRGLVMSGLEQIKEGKTKDFNAVCDRLEKNTKNEALPNMSGKISLPTFSYI